MNALMLVLLLQAIPDDRQRVKDLPGQSDCYREVGITKTEDQILCNFKLVENTINIDEPVLVVGPDKDVGRCIQKLVLAVRARMKILGNCNCAIERGLYAAENEALVAVAEECGEIK